MNLYEFIQNMIRLLPLILLLPAFIFLLRFKWYQRLGLMFALGWVVIAGTTLLYWHYAINYAPSQKIMIDLALRDGAPRVFGTLFGWVFGTIILFIFEIVRLIYLGLNSLTKRLKQKNA